uniref:Protein kinase domain-containing protein n=1 Tax=Setaria italica TaxID=4555 RepID=K3XG69_SETIT
MSGFLVIAFLLWLHRDGVYTTTASADEDLSNYSPPSQCRCSGQDTIFVHPILAPYKVTAIDYRSATLTIIPHLNYSPCPLDCQLHFTQSKNDGDYIVGPVSCLSNTTHLLYLVYADADMSIFPLDCKAVSDARIPIPVADIMPYTTFKEQVEMILSGATMTVSWSNHEHHPEFAFSGTQCGRQGQLCEFAGRTIFGSPMFVGQCNYEPGIAYNCTQCERQGQHCVFNSQMNQTFCMPHGSRVKVIAATSSTAALVVILLMVATALYLSLKFKCFSTKPTRYTFAEVKKIARLFKEKVGQGGFGSVYKGELPSGVPVAVKMLENSTGEGDEFINEVATIGLIHHANFVRLLGFCSQGTRRALIYEFMPNESLEKYIFLHASGASQQLLPHNILLYYKFNPKISDFGLAKLCARDQSIVTLTTARGTMGYIAPELYSRNFGEVSYKSDVYSFGMLVLEMVSGRRNSDPGVASQNEVYLPEWIFEKVITWHDLVLAREMTGEEREKIRQLAIVALWCIQWNPRNRPSMTKVVNMLTGRLENLQMPPKPFISSESHPVP